MTARAATSIYNLSDEASAALQAATDNYAHNLETKSRLIANKREVLVAGDVHDAETELLANAVGTTITIVVAWLRPAGFFCLGLSAPAVQQVVVNQAVQPGHFIMGLIGMGILGATIALDAQTVRIKRFFRRKKEKKFKTTGH